jgi:hypothetical protein
MAGDDLKSSAGNRASPCACFPAPRGRTLTHAAPEQLAQMSLIGKTAFLGNVAD